MTSRTLVPLGELNDAAFALLTTSSLGRYIRTAKEAATRSTLRRWLGREPERIPDILAHARTSWRAVLDTTERDVPEWELAIVLPILARTAGSEVDGLLQTVAVSERPNAAWLAALARRLLQERAENQSGAGPWRGSTEARPASVENHADSRRERLLRTDGLSAHSSEDQASQRTVLVAV